MFDSSLLPAAQRGPLTHRRNIYYWKCDRPAAFHGTLRRHDHEAIRATLTGALEDHFGQDVTVTPSHGQGNHVTFNAVIGGAGVFVRVEDGPEGDGHLAVESRIQEMVRTAGIPAPRILGVDASRAVVPFAWQVMEHVNCPDLNSLFKSNQLCIEQTFRSIGQFVGSWQALQYDGFGPYHISSRQDADAESLEGYHASYADYFSLHLERHLSFLVKHAFLTRAQSHEVEREIQLHARLLELPHGCLVHKDLALWNILGTSEKVTAFIDWDDAICGDPMDDLSLLACFHDGHAVLAAWEGYASVRHLPEQSLRRFWLHLLRNMLVKAVIRVGAGYFDCTDSFFLIGNGSSGGDLKSFTQDRLQLALRGLRDEADITLIPSVSSAKAGAF